MGNVHEMQRPEVADVGESAETGSTGQSRRMSCSGSSFFNAAAGNGTWTREVGGGETASPECGLRGVTGRDRDSREPVMIQIGPLRR